MGGSRKESGRKWEDMEQVRGSERMWEEVGKEVGGSGRTWKEERRSGRGGKDGRKWKDLEEGKGNKKQGRRKWKKT